MSIQDTEAGFRYRAGQARIAPDMVETSRGWVLPAGRSDWQDVMVLQGGGATPRAVGIYILQAQQGRLFPQDAPYAPEILKADSMQSFVKAAAQHGHTLLPVNTTMPHLPLRW